MISINKKSNFIVTEKHEKIFQIISKTNKNLCISATAGSGKTTTLLECLKLIPRFKKSVFLSFSNSIVDELKERVPKHITASTLHSLGSRMVYSYYPGIKMLPNKFLGMALDSHKKRDKNVFKQCYIIQDICHFARLTMTPFEEEALYEMCNYYDIDWSDENIKMSIELLEKDKKSTPKFMDFTDMVWLPASKPEIINTKYDVVFLDECQDSNNSQIKFVENLLSPTGRLISVGDPCQSIYSFTGSNIDSFKKLLNRQNTDSLPLSVSYRCSKRIVEQAKKIYEDIEPHENAIEGEVRNGFLDEVTEGDLIVCRNNAPLVDAYFSLIERNLKAHIIGKEIEKDLINIVEDCMANTADKLEQNLYKKLEVITQKLLAKGVSKPNKHEKFLNFLDKIELILLILSKVQKTNQLIDKIKEIFDDSVDGCRLMTIHKSKGLENKRVFLIEFHKGKRLLPSQFAEQEWQKIQENNLLFVAITRAKESLIYLSI